MTAVADALETLGVAPGTLPAPKVLADLFVRFQAQVPLRDAPEERSPEELLSAWLEEGGGCCGASRVLAFSALAETAGFALETRFAQGPRGAADVLVGDEGRLLLDPAFPLPAPLALEPPAEGIATGYGTLAVRPGADGAKELVLETRGEERLLYRVERRPAEPGGGSATATGVAAPAVAGGGDSPFIAHARGPLLFRLLEDRLLRWEAGVLEVTDSWSRLRVPFAASDADGLEALFGPPIPPTAGSVEPPEGEPTLAAYLASTVEPGRLRELLANPAASPALLPEGWCVEGLARREDGFERTLVEEGRLLRRERIVWLPDGIRVEAEGPLALFRARTWRLEARPAGTRLRLLAAFRDPVPPRGLPDASRRRLVFELASELLALDRLASSS